MHIGIIEKYIPSGDNFSGMFVVCVQCDRERHSLISKSKNCSVNLMLNTYSIDRHIMLDTSRYIQVKPALV